MKKIYLLTCAALLAVGAQAQQTLKVKFNKSGSEVNRSAGTHAHKGGSPGNSPMQVATTVVANNGYVANTTLNISFTMNSTNADLEYVDSIAFTFPATFTVNGSSANPFPTTDAGGGPEALNGVSGQTISWGVNNNDQYGGIWCSPAQSFDINVSVAPGTTGNQVVYYHASGDGYGTGPGDENDSVIIMETLPMDAKLVAINDLGISCTLGSAEVITAWIKNLGFDTIKGFTATYVINGGTPVVENPTDTILPGDTLMYDFTTTANLSAANVYSIFVGASAMGDANLANDTGSVVAENYVSQDVVTTPLTMGFEPGADSIALERWTVANLNGDVATWALINTYVHTGMQCIRKPGSAANDDDWLMSNCLDLQATNTYRLEFWYKYFQTTAVVGLEAWVGNDNDPSAMTQNLVSVPTPTDTSYKQVVLLFTVPTNGTYHVGFHAVASAGTASIRIDDINLGMSPVGVQENAVKQLSIYPNPSTGLCFIHSYVTNAQVEVFNLVGEKVFSKTMLNKGSNAIDLSNLTEGSYIVRVINGNEVMTKKIVITK